MKLKVRMTAAILGLLALIFHQPSSRLLATHSVAHPHSVRQIWSIDLSGDPDFSLREALRPQRLGRPGLKVLHNGTLVLSFDDGYPLTRLELSAISRQDHPLNSKSPGSFRYHALFFNPNNGAVQERMNWPTESDMSTILPTKDGFATLAGDNLKRYSEDYKLLGEIRVPAHPEPGLPRSDFWDGCVALSGDVIVLAHKTSATKYEWLRSEDFKSLGSVTLDGFGHFSCTDTLLARPYMLANRNGKTINFCGACKAYRAEFLDRDHLLLLLLHKFEVLDISGAKVAEGKLPATVQIVSSSAESGRFALGSTSLDLRNGWGFNVLVFDWKNHEKITSLNFQKQISSRKRVDVGFNHWSVAISPDGSQLAVLKDKSLEMYQIQ